MYFISRTSVIYRRHIMTHLVFKASEFHVTVGVLAAVAAAVVVVV